MTALASLESLSLIATLPHSYWQGLERQTTYMQKLLTYTAEDKLIGPVQEFAPEFGQDRTLFNFIIKKLKTNMQLS